METLKLLLQSKQDDCALANEVVAAAVSWMGTQFHNAEVSYHYSDGGVGHGVYGYFQIKSLLKDTAITLHLKIAEINGLAYASVEVRVRDQHQGILFPYFGEFASEEGKLTLLHFISDFLLSTTLDVTGV
ncbi:MAG: hypothetical protein K9N23_19365 [Akkermansiaceae bacterium]|nr:hypothetical protein [Akkermansiaceae bacterium]